MFGGIMLLRGALAGPAVIAFVHVCAHNLPQSCACRAIACIEDGEGHAALP